MKGRRLLLCPAVKGARHKLRLQVVGASGSQSKEQALLFHCCTVDQRAYIQLLLTPLCLLQDRDRGLREEGLKSVRPEGAGRGSRGPVFDRHKVVCR